MEGKPKGATEEFLQRRIPMQFGGMNDPFGPAETKKSISLETLRILAEYDYPTIISTKGTLLANEEYLTILASGNFYVRISIAAIDPMLSSVLEAGVPSVRDRLKCAEKIAYAGVPVSLRLQPIIPGFETTAENLITEAANHGCQHISAEYLKLPIETTAHNFAKLQITLPGIRDFYSKHCAIRSGREYILPTDFKKTRLNNLKSIAQNYGLLFGFAENELLLQNNFSACCNASDKFLRDANYFNFNIIGILKSQLRSRDIRFKVSDNEWFPTQSVFSHLNSKSRIHAHEKDSRDTWKNFLKGKWNATPWRGGPDSFDGIVETGALDLEGNKIYKFVNEATAPV